jgi:hypothetical protein
MAAKRKYRGESERAYKKRRRLKGGARKKANTAAVKKYSRRGR